MALDATKQARLDEINTALRSKDRRSGTEREALRRELAQLLGAETAPAGAGAAATDPQDAARAADLTKALRGQLSATDRAAIRNELWEILARDPHAAGMAASAAGTPAGAPPDEPIVLAPSLKITPRVVELTEQLRGNPRHGSTERQQTLAALEAELLASDGAGATAAGSEAT